MDERPRYSLRQLAAAGQAETLLATEIHLPEPAATLREARRTVLIDSTGVTPGHVILQGRLRLDYIYTVSQNGSTSGPVHSHTLDTAFAIAIPAEGAAPEMEATLADAYVTAGEITGLAQDRRGAIHGFRDLSLVRLSVRLWQETEVAAPSPTGRQAPPPARVCMSRFTSRGKKR